MKAEEEDQEFLVQHFKLGRWVGREEQNLQKPPGYISQAGGGNSATAKWVGHWKSYSFLVVVVGWVRKEEEM